MQERIDEIQDEEVKEALKAIKLIGNEGSHSDANDFSYEILLDAFEIIHAVLEKQYSTRTEYIKTMIKKINDSRK